MKRTDSNREIQVVIALILAVAIPFAATLATIKTGRPPIEIPADPAANPSPYGYTWSLLLYLIPDLLLGSWVLAMHRGPREKKAFWVTVGLLIPLWCLLDVFFGLTFFKYPNLGASVGTFWGYTFDRGWAKEIPLEEIAFYALGFIGMILVYIWGDEYFFAAYKKPEPKERCTMRQLLKPHVGTAIVGVVLAAAAIGYKKLGPHDYHEGIPGYFLFMLACCILPSLFCYRIAFPRINWRAFSFGFFFMLFISLFWEGAVGVPYQWWDYNRGQMMGIFIPALTGLPFEAVLLWFCASWTNTLVYVTIRSLLPSEAAKTGG